LAKVRQDAATKRRQMLLAGGAVAVVVVAAAIYAYVAYAGRSSGPPRLNAPPVAIAKFIGTPEFDQLPFDRQRLYMKEVGGKKKDLEAEFKAGRLSREEWKDTLAVLWLGKRFKQIDRYNSLGPYDKKAYLRELADEDIKDDLEDDAKPKGTPKRDKDKVKALIERFPDADRRAYEGFHKAYKDMQKEREEEAKAAKKAAKAAATQATTRPAKP
jgi:hypothetical protein